MQVEACIELAKIYEHKLKQYMKAIHYTEKALDIQSKQKKEKQEGLNKKTHTSSQQTSIL